MSDILNDDFNKITSYADDTNVCIYANNMKLSLIHKAPVAMEVNKTWRKSNLWCLKQMELESIKNLICTKFLEVSVQETFNWRIHKELFKKINEVWTLKTIYYTTYFWGCSEIKDILIIQKQVFWVICNYPVRHLCNFQHLNL